MNTVKSTTNYSQFKKIPGNRSIKKGHIFYLVKSIRKTNLLADRPIMINEKMEVVDGQHRLEAARKLNVPIFYMVSTGDLKTVQILNANTRNWGWFEFLESYIKAGNKEYVFFKEFIEKYEYPFSICLYLLLRPGQKNAHMLSEVFREGQFKVVDIDQTMKIVEDIEAIKSFSHPACFKSNRFYDAIIRARYENPKNIVRLIHSLNKKPYKINRMETTLQYIHLFEEILARTNARLIPFI